MDAAQADQDVAKPSHAPEAPATAAAAVATAAAAAAAADDDDPAASHCDALRSLSREGWLRTGGSLRGIVSASHGVAGLVGLHGGLPPDGVFPLASLSFGTADGRSVQLDAAALAAAQQYNVAAGGHPPLQRWAAAHVAALHAPPGPCGVLVTDGTSHALEMVCSLFVDSGDAVLVEEYSYPQFLECHLVPRGCEALPVPMDGAGIRAEGLEQVLAARVQRGQRMPRLLITVPTAQNPTGATTPLQHKRAVYEVCRRYGLLIVEDDAYFYLQFPDGPSRLPGVSGLPRAASYLSLDTDGRVIRLDSFSKFLAPGLRLGWAAAPPGVIDKLTQVLQAQTLGPAGFSQARPLQLLVITAALLEAWGEAGLDAHVRRTQAAYAHKAAAMAAAAARELRGLVEWEAPRAGMFMWVRLLGVEEASELLPALRAARVVVVPGRICHPRSADPSFRCPYVRLAFSHPPAESLEEGVRRLGAVLRQAQAERQQQAGGGGA